MRLIYAVQIFRNEEVWESIYVSTYLPDAEDVLSDCVILSNEHGDPFVFRLVSFSVSDLNFIGTHARDFAVLDRHGC